MDVRAGPSRRLSAKEWCFWIVILKKTLESSLDWKDLDWTELIKSVNPEGNQSWIFTARTDAAALILWPLDAKCQLTGKDPDVSKDWRQRRGQQRMKWLDSISDSVDTNLSKLQEIAEDRGAWHAPVHGVTKSLTQLSTWIHTHTHTYIFTFIKRCHQLIIQVFLSTSKSH